MERATVATLLPFSSLALLPFLALISLIAALRREGGSLADAVLTGALVWTAMAVAMAEALGAMGALATGPLAATWAGLMVLCAARIALRWRRVPVAQASGTITSSPSEERGGTAGPGGRRAVVLLIMGIAALLVITAAIALMAPPNTWDSHTYHLARVDHWEQNRGLAHYPTAINRQLVSAPLAEILIAHLRLLSDGDRLANMVQWLAQAGSLVAVARIAAALGLPVLGQVVAAVVAATLPMGILQSTSTQNDLVTAFFLAVAAGYALRWRARARIEDAGWFGLAVGLAVLTKGTAYFYALPLGLAAVTVRVPGRRLATALVLAAMAAAAPNLPAWSRNAMWFGTPIGPQYGVAQTAPGVGATVSVLLRSAASHLMTPVPVINHMTENVVLGLHEVLGLDPDDPDTTFPQSKFELSPSIFDENQAGNGLHIVLIGCAFAILLAQRRSLPPGAVAHALVVAGSMLIFSALLRWQPWVSRLHLPFFVLAAPLVALAAARVAGGRWQARLGWGLLLAAIPWLLFNISRPVWFAPLAPWLARATPEVWTGDRDRLLFARRPELLPLFVEVADDLKARGVHAVALMTGEDSWEHPLWALLRDRFAARPRIEHVCAAPPGKGSSPAPGFPLGSFQGEVLLVLDRPTPPVIDCGGQLWRRERVFAGGDHILSGIALYTRRL
jgi:hypothetical protein